MGCLTNNELTKKNYAEQISSSFLKSALAKYQVLLLSWRILIKSRIIPSANYCAPLFYNPKNLDCIGSSFFVRCVHN